MRVEGDISTHSVKSIALRHAKILADFPEALTADDQLSLVYQPQIDLATREWIGVEALIRWMHPLLGAISPAEFIPLVETTPLANRLMRWVAAAALRQKAIWQQSGIQLSLSINASARNLNESDFAEYLLDEMAANGVDPTTVKLEFTENGLSHIGQVTHQIEILRDHGVAIALDDFGTGHSNLSYLLQLPISILKIDQSFIRNLDTSAKDEKLVRALINLARNLNHRVVAEGIENAETLEMLREWGCDEGQGYHISRPITAELITAHFLSRKAA